MRQGAGRPIVGQLDRSIDLRGLVGQRHSGDGKGVIAQLRNLITAGISRDLDEMPICIPQRESDLIQALPGFVVRTDRLAEQCSGDVRVSWITSGTVTPCL